MLQLNNIRTMDQFNLAVFSRISLFDNSQLSQSAELLGQIIADYNYNLLTNINMTLSYKVAQGTVAKTGLSIGFSSARNCRHHVLDQQLPTDVYDWIYFNAVQENITAVNMLSNAQGVILVGVSLENITELSLSLAEMLPIGILAESQSQPNSLVEYVKTLSVDQQKRIVIETNVQKLMESLNQMVNEYHQDINKQRLNQNNKFFHQLFEKAQ